MLRRPLGKDIEKTQIFRTLGTVKMRLPLTRELNFHFSQGTPKDSQNGAKIEPKLLQNPSGDALGSLRERSLKLEEKTTQNRCQKGANMDPQIAPKIRKKNEDALQSTTGKPKSLLEFENEAQIGENYPKKLPHGAQHPPKINKGSAA